MFFVNLPKIEKSNGSEVSDFFTYQQINPTILLYKVVRVFSDHCTEPIKFSILGEFHLVPGLILGYLYFSLNPRLFFSPLLTPLNADPREVWGSVTSIIIYNTK